MKSLKNVSVLYAEDEAIIRMAIGQKLKNYFKKVYVAKDGKEAMDVYLQSHPDVLILDLEMPYKNGIEIAGEVRQNNPDIPIVILTAYSEKTFMHTAMGYDLISYLIKPVRDDKLLETLKQISKKF